MANEAQKNLASKIAAHVERQGGRPVLLCATQPDEWEVCLVVHGKNDLMVFNVETDPVVAAMAVLQRQSNLLRC